MEIPDEIEFIFETKQNKQTISIKMKKVLNWEIIEEKFQQKFHLYQMLIINVIRIQSSTEKVSFFGHILVVFIYSYLS